jgi:hypothetical protein
MLVLLVDCYGDPKSKDLKSFARLLRGWFADAAMRNAVGHLDIVTRRLNNLYDYAIDWEYDQLDENGRNICRRFDCLSLIVVVGDMKIAPWHMSSSQLVTLLWMAETSKKPTLCCGAGAFFAVYSAAGQGTKFNILNQPNGESLERLPHYPRYSRPMGQFPGAWMDNETGDVYTYNTYSKQWGPIGNVGIYRCAMRGEPTPSRFRPVVKHFASADHALRMAQVPEAIGDEEHLAYVRSKFVDHFSMKNLGTTSFVCSIIPDFYLNPEGSLPCNGMCVAAETEMGPAVLVRDLSIYIAAKVGDDTNQADVRNICRNYVDHIVTCVASRNDGNLGDSVFVFLFGDGGTSGGSYDSIKHKKTYAAPLSRQHVASRLPLGPLRGDAPLLGMFLEQAPQGDAPVRAAGGGAAVGGKAQTKITFATTSPLRPVSALRRGLDDPSSPMNPKNDIDNISPEQSPRRAPNLSVRDPHKNRKKRLAKFLKSVGHKGMLSLNKQIAAENARCDPHGVGDAAPDSARDIFQGLRMDTNSVFTRRPHHGEREQGHGGGGGGATATGGLSPCVAADMSVSSPSPLRNQLSASRGDGEEGMGMGMGTGMGMDVRDDMSDRGEDIFAAGNDSTDNASDINRGTRNPYNANKPTSGRGARPKSALPQVCSFDLSPNPGTGGGGGRRGLSMTRGSSIVEGAMSVVCLPVSRPLTAGKMPSSVEYITRQSSKPFNNKQKFDELEERDRQKHVSEYEGAFRGGYRSAYEKDRLEHKEAKKSFIGGDFHRHFDRASSMPLREEGAIRPHGAYPKNAPNSMHLKPDDWHHIRDDVDVKKAVGPSGGAWNPVTKNNSFMSKQQSSFTF